MSNEFPPVDVRVIDHPRVPELVVRQSVAGTRFEPPPRTHVQFRNAHANEVDFSRAHFYIFASSGCLFTRCDFQHVRVAYGGTLSGRSQTVYRDSRFDGADLSPLDPGTARFERCTFDRANLEGWNCFDTEFVDCHFAGRIEGVKFWGHSPGLKIFKRRRVNEFRGNDFREVELIDTQFTGGIDLQAQQLPTGDAYIRLDRIDDRIARVREEILRWPDGRARHEALVMLMIYEGRPRQKQVELFTRRDDLEIDPNVRNRVWDMLQHALP